jgi:hypothetical protein
LISLTLPKVNGKKENQLNSFSNEIKERRL